MTEQHTPQVDAIRLAHAIHHRDWTTLHTTLTRYNITVDTPTAQLVFHLAAEVAWQASQRNEHIDVVLDRSAAAAKELFND